MDSQFFKDIVAREIRQKKQTNRLMILIAVVGVLLFIVSVLNIRETLENREQTLINREETKINRTYGEKIVTNQKIIIDSLILKVRK